MANFFVCLVLFRILLPIFLLACIAFRPSALSAIYFIFLLILPCVPVPTPTSMASATGLYLKLLIATSVLTTTAQIAFQIVLAALPPYGGFLKNCEMIERVLRLVGLVKLNDLDALSIITWVSPEIVMICISIAFYITCNKLTIQRLVDVASTQEDLPRKGKANQKVLALVVAGGKYAALAALCFAAVFRPSVQGGFYFLVFLSAATWWACCKPLGKAFAIVMRIVMVVAVLHMISLYAYQFEWTQEYFNSTSPYSRYFAMTQFYKVNCTEDPRVFEWIRDEWATYVNPLAIFLLYYVLALESKFLLKPQLIRGVSPSKRYGSGKKIPSGFQDSTGSVTITGDNYDDIPLDQLGTTEDEFKPTFWENVVFALETLLQVIIKSSYIVTNIIMMAWSITYLSWITFVLLLWANILWLVPNQRKSMLWSSPILVFYAAFLLLSSYIYSMNLTDAELPSKIEGWNLTEIGFVKTESLPCNPLLIKCLFTCMFWITLRQYMGERIQQRQSNALADMVAPLQISVGAAAGVTNEQEPGSKLMTKFGNILRDFLTKFWIWIVAITLFAVAITGERMTVFRIVYMGLFLIFILLFQLSFKVWRQIMFVFWLVVIVYSMLILVLVYTYQFNHFDEYWAKYIHVTAQVQKDIGLERFDTKDLFVRLVTPTFFVIITVIQLHYFHKDFMVVSDPKNTSVIGVDLDQSSLQGGAAPMSERDETTTSSLKNDLSEIDDSKHKWRRCVKRIKSYYNLVFLFLELHMPKFVLIFLMLLCIYDKCALHFVLVVLVVFACILGRPMQIISIYASSVFVSLMLLARMVYQIDYIEPGNWNVTCTFPNNVTKIENNAKWLGFYKTGENGLAVLVKWNILYILVVTLWSVILIRQFNYKVSKGKPTTRAFFMFPRITKMDADKDLCSCIKYLLNYGFYKFGVEICLIATVAVIGFRMDMYSIIYSIWLCILFNLKRSTLSRVWSFYMIFIALLLPIQYLMTVGIPPTLCISFPWDNEFWENKNTSQAVIYRKFQEFAYLLDTEYPPAAKKLICDFLLLLLVSRQAVVFRIEARWEGREYQGGSNESIIHHAEEKGFVNPIHDYISTVRSYLDVLKKGFFSSFIWITLAIVFLAGTSRVNIFSIGYLMGAFMFLWVGTDLYLRPIPKILKSWDILLAYNVFVILIKTSLQICGCIFIQDIPSHSCWIIQLLGIGCVKKFGDLSVTAGIVDDDSCKVPREYVGLVWDGLCFGFMIVQRRIFQSYNFFCIIDEIKAATILASRGAELIEELRLKRMREQEELEKRVLEKIKAKMDKIKANQQKLQGNFKETDSHYVDSIYKGRPLRRRKEPQTYKEAVRSGDYYMFDDLDDEDDLDLLESKSSDLDPDIDKGQTVGEIEHVPRSVKIIDERDKFDDPQPGTSRDEDSSDILVEPTTSVRQKIVVAFKFVWMFIQTSLVSLTNFLNNYSKDYRYVLRVLAKEKKILKENTDYNVGVRVGSGQLWQPAASYASLLRQSRDGSSDIDEEYDVTEMSSYDQPPIIRLLLAIWYIIMSRSENVCYFIIFLNQIKSASFLSLPLPLMVFFWGSLTIPRPDKTFWVTIIAYTEIIVLMKCMFQFDIIPWNKNQGVINSPMYPPKIIGIERNSSYAVYDLLLLLVVFFHRFMLKSMGLWKTSPVTAALLTDGEYRVGANGKLEQIDTLTTSRSTEKVSPPSKASDLQKLVEETDDPDDDKIDEISAHIYSDNDNKLVVIHTRVISPFTHFPEAVKLGVLKYGEAMKIFMKKLRDPTSRVAADVYSYMFLCDFFNFFVILFGYSSFGTQQGDGGVSSYIQDNRVPVLFLLMLILQFTLIIIDRGIFLRKNILAKILFQFVQVFVLHIWLFIIFPIITERGFNSVVAPQMYYMVKCFYLLLSAYQIRCGYPTRILGNFLCKGYNYANMFLFKGFMAIPFLFELRTVMDWMWTDTSMTVFDWIKMEDIFAHIFQLKCSRHVENEYPQPRGERKPPFVKYLMGGGILLVIIAIIWFPLVFFSLGNAVGKPNIPYDVSLEIRIGPYEPVYMMSAQSNNIYPFSESDYSFLAQTYLQQKSAATFISYYDAADIAAVKLSTDSANIWSISPPDRTRMIKEVNSTKPLSISLIYKISHKTSKAEDAGLITENVNIKIPAFIDGKPNENRKKLLNMLVSKDNSNNFEPLLLENILPKFLKVSNKGTAKAVSQLMFKDKQDAESTEPVGLAFRNATLVINIDQDKEWWIFNELCDDYSYHKFLSQLAKANCKNSILLYTFNDKIFPSTLTLLTGGGIVGLYTTLVFVASRFFRGFFAEQCFKIMFEDMPNIDRVLQLCLDIYLVREAREYTLEEDLFAKLVFLFRSPETMIKWTRPKEEVADDDDPEEDA